MNRVDFKTVAVANQSGAMEADTIEKNGRNSKSQTSRKVINYLIIAFIAVVTMVACVGVGKGNIVMKAETDKIDFSMSGAGNVIIDWGDGTRETHEIGDDSRLRHEYSGRSVRTITITGKNIMKLNCSRNELTSLDVSKAKTLTSLSCGNNQLSILDLSKNTELTSLSIHNCPLTSLDVSKNNALRYLTCYYNKLTNLDVSESNELITLICQGNQLTGSVLDNLFRMLPNNEGEKIISIIQNPGEESCNKSIAMDKGWRFGFQSSDSGFIFD